MRNAQEELHAINRMHAKRNERLFSLDLQRGSDPVAAVASGTLVPADTGFTLAPLTAVFGWAFCWDSTAYGDHSVDTAKGLSRLSKQDYFARL
jgi:hypothetical protein